MDGAILYSKTSLGQHGKPITIRKIRTMYRNADKDLGTLVATHGLDWRGGISNDPRVTPVGKVLRKYWINELPQVYNWLKGDLAFVGLRPGTEEEWSHFPQDLKARALQHKPGLIPPHYAWIPNDFNEYVAISHRYLDLKEQAPLLTDTFVVLRFLYNVIFRGLRSK